MSIITSSRFCANAQIALVPLTLCARATLYVLSLFQDPQIHQNREYFRKIINNPELLDSPAEYKRFSEIFYIGVNEEQKKIFLTIESLFSDSKVFIHLFKGANVMLEDNGVFYKKWNNLETPQTRPSSHNHRENKAKSTFHPICKELLFWQDKDTGHTHLQMERYPVLKSAFSITALAEAILHLNDYFDYRIKNHQAGPLGTSPYTDQKPICIEKEKCWFTAEAFETRCQLP